MAALLTLAIFLAGPPVGHSSASVSNQTAKAETLGHFTHTEQSDQHRHHKVKLNVDCNATALGCCMMAHCCPGNLVDLHDVPLVDGEEETKTASAVRCTGSNPWIVLPPPRLLLA